VRDYAENMRMMKECRKYIEIHLYDEIKPEDLAAHFNYSYASFRRIFREIGGYTVYEYIRLRRIQNAAKYLRHGGDLVTAAKISCFKTNAGFYKAFLDIYGVIPSEFMHTRGKNLMHEPKIVQKPSFYVVGYVLPGELGMGHEERAAYWIAQEFPDVSPREYARIGGGLEMVGVWDERKESPVYIIGPSVKKVRYVPALMDQVFVPGGAFAAFPIAESENNTMLWENAKVTWFFAYNQWMPDSDYVVDETRIPYEYYLDGSNVIYVPIEPKIKP